MLSVSRTPKSFRGGAAEEGTGIRAEERGACGHQAAIGRLRVRGPQRDSRGRGRGCWRGQRGGRGGGVSPRGDARAPDGSPAALGAVPHPPVHPAVIADCAREVMSVTSFLHHVRAGKARLREPRGKPEGSQPSGRHLEGCTGPGPVGDARAGRKRYSSPWNQHFPAFCGHVTTARFLVNQHFAAMCQQLDSWSTSILRPCANS